MKLHFRRRNIEVKSYHYIMDNGAAVLYCTSLCPDDQFPFGEYHQLSSLTFNKKLFKKLKLFGFIKTALTTNSYSGATYYKFTDWAIGLDMLIPTSISKKELKRLKEVHK